MDKFIVITQHFSDTLDSVFNTYETCADACTAMHAIHGVLSNAQMPHTVAVYRRDNDLVLYQRQTLPD